MERQIREMEKEVWGYKGTGSSVTFRDKPLVPGNQSWRNPPTSNGEVRERPRPPKTYADEVE